LADRIQPGPLPCQAAKIELRQDKQVVDNSGVHMSMTPPVSTIRSADGTPPAEYAIDEALVSRLLAEQHPDLTHLAVRALEAGWDNAMFRLGDHLAVRLPRRAVANQLIANEQRCLSSLASSLPLPVPAPCRIGRPGLGYPCAWSILPWLHGMSADICGPDVAQAIPFAEFLRALHVPAPKDAPMNPFRGVPLRERSNALEARLVRLASRTRLITPRVRRIWQEALEAPVNEERVWLHGDLHPRNVLVERGVISGVIDWGDITSGDCATDLAASWMLFDDPGARAELQAEYGPVPPATWVRAKGWAVLFGLVFLETGLTDNPRHAEIGARILSRVAA